MSDDEKLIGKTIVWAQIGGYGVKLKFSDGSILDYSSSDGGYSCWEIIDDTKQTEMNKDTRGGRMMNLQKCEISNGPRETVHSILDDIDAIQKETEHELSMIADAVYRGDTVRNEGVSADASPKEPIVVQYARQRDTAKRILKAVVQIREALW